MRGPLVPAPRRPLDKIVTFIPVGPAITAVRDALSAAGAGRIGDYSHCSFATAGTGQFKPLDGAHPTIGEVGQAGAGGRDAAGDGAAAGTAGPRCVAALRAAHPYEEPAFDVLELADLPSSRGLGRVGTLPAPEPLAAFAARVAAALPATARGVRAAGDPERPIETVAVCGGAGDSALGAAVGAGVDAYVTADLRHHPASEHLLAGSLSGRPTPALVDVAHWASEWPWCGRRPTSCAAALGGSVEVRVSRRRTDPWTVAPSAERTQ